MAMVMIDDRTYELLWLWGAPPEVVHSSKIRKLVN